MLGLRLESSHQKYAMKIKYSHMKNGQYTVEINLKSLLCFLFILE